MSCLCFGFILIRKLYISITLNQSGAMPSSGCDQDSLCITSRGSDKYICQSVKLHPTTLIVHLVCCIVACFPISQSVKLQQTVLIVHLVCCIVVGFPISQSVKLQQTVLIVHLVCCIVACFPISQSVKLQQTVLVVHLVCCIVAGFSSASQSNYNKPF